MMCRVRLICRFPARELAAAAGDRSHYSITSTAIDLTATLLTRPAAVSSRMALVRARRATGSGSPKRSMSTRYSASRLILRPSWSSVAVSDRGLVQGVLTHPTSRAPRRPVRERFAK